MDDLKRDLRRKAWREAVAELRLDTPVRVFNTGILPLVIALAIYEATDKWTLAGVAVVGVLAIEAPIIFFRKLLKVQYATIVELRADTERLQDRRDWDAIEKDLGRFMGQAQVHRLELAKVGVGFAEKVRPVQDWFHEVRMFLAQKLGDTYVSTFLSDVGLKDYNLDTINIHGGDALNWLANREQRLLEILRQVQALRSSRARS